jgi:hypothetical protein
MQSTKASNHALETQNLRDKSLSLQAAIEEEKVHRPFSFFSSVSELSDVLLRALSLSFSLLTSSPLFFLFLFRIEPGTLSPI